MKSGDAVEPAAEPKPEPAAKAEEVIARHVVAVTAIFSDHEKTPKDGLVALRQYARGHLIELSAAVARAIVEIDALESRGKRAARAKQMVAALGEPLKALRSAAEAFYARAGADEDARELIVDGQLTRVASGACYTTSRSDRSEWWGHVYLDVRWFERKNSRNVRDRALFVALDYPGDEKGNLAGPCLVVGVGLFEQGAKLFADPNGTGHWLVDAGLAAPVLPSRSCWTFTSMMSSSPASPAHGLHLRSRSVS